MPKRSLGKQKKVFLIGVGPGAPELLTGQAQRALTEASYVYGTKRLCALCNPIRPDAVAIAVEELGECALSAPHGTVALLLSGDTGFFSAAKRLFVELAKSCQVECICGISSMQYFLAKLQKPYEQLPFVSLHGREGSLLGAVSYHPAVFVLTGGKKKAHLICKELSQRGLGNVLVSAGENLSMEGERILTGTAEALSEEVFSDLTVLFIENSKWIDPHLPLRDGDFIRGKVPMTKEETRLISVAKLRVGKKDVVWDIGAGTGSVSIELARKAVDGLVYAVERREDAYRLIEQNRQKLGSYNVIPVLGEAPACLDILPTPDRVFIGGNGGMLSGLLPLLFERNLQLRVVINAVTMETVATAVSLLQALHCSVEMITLNVSRAREIGTLHMMEAQNPVTVIVGEIINTV